MDYQAIRAVLDADPGTYGALSDAQAAAALNAATQSVEVQEVGSAQIYEAIDRAEYDALTAGNKAEVNTILGLGGGIKVNGSKTKTVLAAIFGAGTTTRANLLDLQTDTRPLLPFVVRESDVGKARAL